MKRLGIRKVANAAYNTKAVDKTDTAITKLVTLPGAILRKVANVTGATKTHNKLKADPNKKFWTERKKANQSVEDKIKLANQKLVMQDALDIASAKEFEREHEENLKALGMDMHTDIVEFSAARQVEKEA